MSQDTPFDLLRGVKADALPAAEVGQRREPPVGNVPHEVVLTLPALPPARFQGMFIENVEPEWTTAILVPR